MIDVTKLIEVMKSIPKTNLLVIVFSISMIILVYNFKDFAPHIESLIKVFYSSTADIKREEFDNIEVNVNDFDDYSNYDTNIQVIEPITSYILSESDLGISSENINIIDNYVSENFRMVDNLYKLPIFLNVYKFIPEGDDRYYQGRVLVTIEYKNNTEFDLVLKELNMIWMPMWINKSTLERLMQNEDFLVPLIRTDNGTVYLQDDLESRGRIDLSIMYDMGIKYIFYHVIENGGEPVGYLAWGLLHEPEEFEMQYIRTRSNILSNRIKGYLNNESIR